VPRAFLKYKKARLGHAARFSEHFIAAVCFKLFAEEVMDVKQAEFGSKFNEEVIALIPWQFPGNARDGKFP